MRRLLFVPPHNFGSRTAYAYNISTSICYHRVHVQAHVYVYEYI